VPLYSGLVLEVSVRAGGMQVANVTTMEELRITRME
jgi:hypothetical protein